MLFRSMALVAVAPVLSAVAIGQQLTGKVASVYLGDLSDCELDYDAAFNSELPLEPWDGSGQKRKIVVKAESV